MLLDVLSEFAGMTICTAYEMDGERMTAFPERRVPARALQAGLRNVARLEHEHQRLS